MAYDNAPDKLKEVLYVEVDQNQFKEGIDALLLQWKDFVEKVGSENVAGALASGASSFQTLADQINTFKTDVLVANQEIASDSQKTANAIIEALELVAAAREESLAAQRLAAAEAAKIAASPEVAAVRGSLTEPTKLEKRQFTDEQDTIKDNKAWQKAEDERIDAARSLAAQRQRALDEIAKDDAARIKQHIAVQQSLLNQRNKEEADLEKQRIAVQQSLLNQRNKEEADLEKQRIEVAKSLQAQKIRDMEADRKETEAMYRRMFDTIASGEAEQERLRIQGVKVRESLRNQRIKEEQEAQVSSTPNTSQEEERLRIQGVKVRESLRNQEIAERTKAVEEEEARIAKVRSVQQSLQAQKQREYNNDWVEAHRERAQRIKAIEENSLSNFLKFNKKRSDSFLESIGKEFARLARYQVEWAAFGAVMSGIGKIISLPFEVIKEGSEFIKETTLLEEKLGGVIAANAKFSDDYGKNMELVNKETKYVVEQLQNLAVATQLSLPGLTQAFESLTQSNAIKGVTDMKQLVDLTKEFALAMRASKVEGNSARQLISEIPKLFTDGVNPESTKFLKVLHLTGEQWIAIRKEGEAHGDLVQRLGEHMKPYLDAAGKAAVNAAETQNSIELLKKRWEALVAGPILAAFVKFMQDVITWATEHKAALDDIAKSIGNVLTEGAKFTFMANDWKGVLSGVVGLFANMAVYAAKIGVLMRENAQWYGKTAHVLGLEEQTPETKAAMKADEGGHNADERRALWEAATKADKRRNEAMDALTYDKIREDSHKELEKLETERLALQKLVESTAKPGVAAPEGDRPKFNPNQTQPPKIAKVKVKQDRHTDSDLKAELEADILTIKAKYEEKTQAIKEQEAQQVITRQQGLNQIRSLDAQELADLNLKVEKYIASLRTSGNIRATEEIKARNLVTALKNAQQKKNDAEELAIIKEGIKNYEAEQNARMKREQQFAKARLAIQQEFASQGYFSEVEMIDKSMALEKEQSIQEAQILRSRQAMYAVGSQERINLERQEKEVQAQYTIAFAENTAKRIGALERERLATRAFSQEMQTIRSQDHIAELTAEDGFRAYTHVLDEVYVAEQKDITSKINSTKAELDLALARNKNIESVRALQLELAKLESTRNAGVRAQISKINGSSAPQPTKDALNSGIVSDALNQRQGELSKATYSYASAEIAGPRLNETAKQFAERMDALKARMDELSNSVVDLTSLQDSMKPSLDKFKSDFLEALIGQDWATFKKAISGANGPVAKMGIIAGAAAQGLTSILNIANAYKQGAAQGGVLGGIGGVLGSLTPALSKLPVVGQYVAAASAVFSFVGGLFTAAAQKAADNINKAFSKTMENFNAGNLDIKDAILQVQNERNQAISQLSGAKGGKDQLAKILPGIDSQLASLKKTAQTTRDTFENSLADLKLHSDALASVAQTWRDINKQAKDYLAASGDIAAAADYLSLKLKAIKDDQTSQLTSGEQTAIQDAIALNSLLQQKVDLQKQFATQAFALANADSVERRGAGVVTRAQQLKDQQTANAKQLQDITDQIDLATKKVAVEAQVFTLANNLADLHRKDEQLTLDALQLQINKYGEMKKIIDSITPNANGLYGLNGSNTIAPAAAQPVGGGVPSVNVTGPINYYGPPNGYGDNGGFNGRNGMDAFGRAIGQEVSKELARQKRLYPHG